MLNASRAFLKNAGWADATPSPVAGDLSVRNYTRLTKQGTSAILMECDPEADTSLPNFVKMTSWLRNLGLSAPEIFAADTSSGLALLEDFGNSKLTSVINQDPSCQTPHYQTILDTLIAIRNAPAPSLETLTAHELCEATKLADEWYPGASPTLLDKFRLGLEPFLKEALETPPTVSLRDFHAENIIWLADRTPICRAGLLDYQDAFLTHPAYDLMSLLTDARIEVAPELRQKTIEAYARKTGDNLENLSQAVAILGAQRNLRILGIFTRAARVSGKTHHLTALPRVYRYLIGCCEHPALAPLSNFITEAVPEPTQHLIESLAS